MVVFFDFPGLNKLVGVKWHFSFLCFFQLSDHRLWLNVFFHTQVYNSPFSGIKHVITFILGIVEAKLPGDIFCRRVDLEAEVSTFHCIEKIKPYRKLCPESLKNFFAKEGFRLVEY